MVSLRIAGVPVFAWILCGLAVSAVAFDDKPSSPATTDNQVVIRREAVRLTNPQHYQVALQLTPAKVIEVRAPVDGVLQSVNIKPGQKIGKGNELIRLDDSRSALLLKRAKAHLQAAKIEKKLASTRKNPDETALADARLEAAQADVDLAELDVNRLVLHSQFEGEIQRVYVSEGQYVRAGDRLATLVDATQLQVEVPVDRSKLEQGQPLEIKVEETAIEAPVVAVLPPEEKFEPLRELVDSLGAALLSIENRDGRFRSGQTVYCDIVPLAPVTTVPTAAIANQPDGNRRVQVLREHLVRDLPVEILARVGTERVYVSGSFQHGDEVIVSSSRELADGTPLRETLLSEGELDDSRPTAGKPAGSGASAGGKKPTKKEPVGF